MLEGVHSTISLTSRIGLNIHIFSVTRKCVCNVLFRLSQPCHVLVKVTVNQSSSRTTLVTTLVSVLATE